MLWQVSLMGSLPSTWAAKGCLPSLTAIVINSASLSGTLPLEWGSAWSFQNLKTLSIQSLGIKGVSPKSNCHIAMQLVSDVMLPLQQAYSTTVCTALTCQDHAHTYDTTDHACIPFLVPLPKGLIVVIINSILDHCHHLGHCHHPWSLSTSLRTIRFVLSWQCHFCSLQQKRLKNFPACPLLSLLILDVGTLPATWAAKGAFPHLAALYMYDVQLTGSLPPTWAQDGCLPSLTILDFNNSQLSGSLPGFWGHALKKLSVLSMAYSNLTGSKLCFLVLTS